MIRIGVADDRPLVRRGLLNVFSSAEDLHVVFEVGDGFELFEKARATVCDVLVLDVSMPGPGFSETMRRLAKRHPEVNVLVLTMQPKEQYAVRALREGAKGYLNKDVRPEELVEAVRRVASGDRYVSAELGEMLVQGLFEDDASPRHAQLSDREFEVLRMVGSGLTSLAIGQRLSISPKTVGTYRSRIREKMGFTSTAEMMRYAITEDLAE